MVAPVMEAIQQSTRPVVAVVVPVQSVATQPQQ
jgi:hypothetical protein